MFGGNSHVKIVAFKASAVNGVARMNIPYARIRRGRVAVSRASPAVLAPRRVGPLAVGLPLDVPRVRDGPFIGGQVMATGTRVRRPAQGEDRRAAHDVRAGADGDLGLKGAEPRPFRRLPPRRALELGEPEP